jgi:hypothetical protein
LNFLEFQKKAQISRFIKIHAVAAELYADRQKGGLAGRRTKGKTEVTKLIDAFRNFLNAPKKEVIMLNIVQLLMGHFWLWGRA